MSSVAETEALETARERARRLLSEKPWLENPEWCAQRIVDTVASGTHGEWTCRLKSFPGRIGGDFEAEIEAPLANPPGTPVQVSLVNVLSGHGIQWTLSETIEPSAVR